MNVRKTVATTAAFALVGGLTTAAVVTSATAAQTFEITIRPSSPNVQGSLPDSIVGDAAPGYADGSIAGNGSLKSDIYVSPQQLFGAPIDIGDVASMSYWTKKGTTHTVDAADWYLNIYTMPYAGDVGDPTNFYGDRIGAEPYFSDNLSDPVNTWNQWSTDGASNTLRFFESTKGAPGANFGTYNDPDWATFSAGNALSGSPYAGHQIMFFSIQTGSAWASGFTGQVDGLRIELTNGDVGKVNFEPDIPCTSVCYVDAATGNDAQGGDTPTTAKKTVQAAINQVDANGQVRVLPGNYSETAANSSPTSLGGTYDFGLFFPSSKPGITLMGVTAGDEPITDASNTQATITTNATNNFGYSGIFVEAERTTIQGLEIGPNQPSDNKTIEVVADDFTLRDMDTSIPDGGAIYLSEFDAPAAPVSSYTITENLFDDGTQVAISSGAGKDGPVGSRQITDNIFDMGGAEWPGISFNGAGGVPWYTKQVGGAVITGNTFSNSTQYIRARGDYLQPQFDWESYWNDNSYDRAAVALVTESPFDVRSYSYTSGSYTFDNVRRIGGTIQGEVDNAVGGVGDTVLVKDGTYREDVVVNKANLKLVGAGIDESTIIGPKGNAALTTLEIPASAPGVSVTGFTVTREGNNVADWTGANGALNNQGVAIYGSGSTLKDSEVTQNRNGVFLYGAQNVSILNNTIDDNRTGIHLVNNVTGFTATNNFITNNWTMGILFRDESSPNPTGTVTVQDNKISGNWYSQIEARSTFSAPALDMTENWLGTTSPTTVSAPDSGEPSYDSQIPTEFGGSATPPADPPTIVWNPSNVFNPVQYMPFQCTGDDASTAIGFQPAGPLSSNLGVCLPDPPAVDTAAADAFGTEGQTLSTSGSFTGTEPLVLTPSTSVGTFTDNGDGTWSWSLVTTDDVAQASMTVTATDPYGQTAQDTFEYRATNVAPTVTSLTPSATQVIVGQSVTWTATVSDPGTDDTHVYSFNGGPFEASPTTTVTYNTCGSFSMTVVARDDDGASSSPYTSSTQVQTYNYQVLSPLSGSAENQVKRGQVVPVQIRVLGCDGATVSGLTPDIRLLKGDKTTIDESNDNTVTTSASSADSGTTMRSVDGKYLYNLRIPSDAVVNGEYTIKIRPFAPTNQEGAILIAMKVRK